MTIKKRRVSSQERFSALLRLDEAIFHVDDLSLLLNIPHSPILNKMLSQWTKKGFLHRLWRGMYSIRPIAQLDPLFIGQKALHGSGYISTETILFQHGIINQRPTAITLVGTFSRRFSLASHSYLVRQLGGTFLCNDEGIFVQDGIRFASPERAVADMLYFQPLAHFDAPVDWQKIREIQQKIGYPITERHE